MRIREPRERWIAWLCVWGALFGGMPLAMLVLPVGGGPSSGVDAPLFLALFPVIAAVVVGTGIRRWSRSGFTVSRAGLEGAHDAERELVPWDLVDRFEWRWAGPTSDVRVNDRPLPSGPALFAVLTDGRVLRVMQACAPRGAQRERIHAQLDEAYERGIVPVHLDRRVHPEDGPGSGPAGADDRGAGHRGGVAVTRWSSSGRGRSLPGAGAPTRWRGLAEQLGRVTGGRGAVDESGDTASADRRDGDDTPSWPTG